MSDTPPPPIPEPPPHHRLARPVSGVDREGAFALGVVTRRTYAVRPGGACELAPEQPPLVDEPIEHPDSRELLLADTDVLLDKPQTDVVVCGHAYNYPGTPGFMASVAVGRHPERQLKVWGDRHAFLDHAGRIAFSSPRARDTVPLSYAFAYGGCDQRAERIGGFELDPLVDRLPPDERELALATASPWRYPRNRAGRGYLVEHHPESIEGLALPNLEDPRDLLTPARLLVHDPAHWPLQPLPASLDWLEHGAFPRLGWFGHTPLWDPDDIGRHLPAFPEIRFGYAGRELFLMDRRLPEHFDRQALNGASLGLRFAYLSGRERIDLTHLHPHHPRWSVQLPAERPRLYVDDRKGGVLSLEARLYSVIIQPDQSLVSVVWGGLTKAVRVYLPAELETMPYLVEW